MYKIKKKSVWLFRIVFCVEWIANVGMRSLVQVSYRAIIRVWRITNRKSFNKIDINLKATTVELASYKISNDAFRILPRSLFDSLSPFWSAARFTMCRLLFSFLLLLLYTLPLRSRKQRPMERGEEKTNPLRNCFVYLLLFTVD